MWRAGNNYSQPAVKKKQKPVCFKALLTLRASLSSDRTKVKRVEVTGDLCGFHTCFAKRGND